MVAGASANEGNVGTQQLLVFREPGESRWHLLPAVAARLTPMSEPGEKAGADVRDTEPREPAEAERVLSFSDIEQIRWALSLPPEDRLAALQDFVDTFWTPRHG